MAEIYNVTVDDSQEEVLLVIPSGIDILDGTVTPYINSVKFNLTPSGTPVQGEIYWDADSQTLAIELDGGTLQLGQEMYTKAVNKTGVQINDGQVVYVSGVQGNRPTAALAQADAYTTSLLIGVATQDIAINAEGFITTLGIVHEYNTSGFTAGDKLYLSATTAGLITNVEPSSPNYGVFIGTALNSTAAGSIFISPDTPIALDTELALDSDLVTPSQKAVKAYVDARANATHSGEVTGATALTIADNVVDEANLKLDEAPTNDYVLTADSAKSGGMKWAAAGGGGTEYQEYKWEGNVDASSLTEWMRINGINTITNEYNINTGVAFTASMTTASANDFYNHLHSGVANGNQTVDSFTVTCGQTNRGDLLKVTILKVKWTNWTSINAVTELYNGSLTLDGTNGRFLINTADFTVSSIDDGDWIYIFYGSQTFSNIYDVRHELKCSID